MNTFVQVGPHTYAEIGGTAEANESSRRRLATDTPIPRITPLSGICPGELRRKGQRERVAGIEPA